MREIYSMKCLTFLPVVCLLCVGCLGLLNPEAPEPTQTAMRSHRRRLADDSQPLQRSSDEAMPPEKKQTPVPTVIDSTFLDELPIGTTLKFMKDVEIPASSDQIEFAFSPHPREDSRGCILFGRLTYQPSSEKRVIRKGFSVHVVSIVPPNPDNPGGDVLRIYETDGPSELRVRVYRVWNMDGGEANGSCANERRLTARDMQFLTKGMLRVSEIPEAKTF